MKELESSVQHKFIDLTSLFSQKAFGKNLRVEQVWWTPLDMIVRCQHNFKTINNPLLKNKYIEGVNKFRGGDEVIQKVYYLQNLPEN